MTTQRLPEARAFGVHLLTATGSLFAMLALVAAADSRWDSMFLWLLMAFVVDGIDGPLARRWDVKNLAPQVDGVLLDLIVDYLTYVFIPAYALFNSGLLEGWVAWAATLIITFASAVYFADTRMKTADNAFSGFPSCWNMAVLVFFAVQPGPWIVLPVVSILGVLMFTRVRFIHPVRTQMWRLISLPMAMVWTAVAGWSAWTNFQVGGWPIYLLVAASLWLLAAGPIQQALGLAEGRER